MSYQDAGIRLCVECGRSIPNDANLCPYCGHDFRYAASPQYSREPRISEGTKIAFYILSLLFFIAGLVLGLIYLTKPDEESKHVGKMCIILGIVGVALQVAVAAILYVMILGFGGSA